MNITFTTILRARATSSAPDIPPTIPRGKAGGDGVTSLGKVEAMWCVVALGVIMLSVVMKVSLDLITILNVAVTKSVTW